jgi:hypothetical protein
MSASAPEFAVNPHCSATLMHVGRDRAPVLIVDDLLLEPQALVRYAEYGSAFRRQDRDFYPGIRKPLDMAYAATVYRHLHGLFLDTFGADAIEPLSCALSLTTTPPQQLRPIQSVPHFDSFDPGHIAGVHYFCAEQFGGTSFYRHRASGYESLDAQRILEYAPRLKQEVISQQSRHFSYIRGDTALFERTGSVAARFNRAIFYRSNVLHSGDIAPETGLSSDPRTGRLTANTLGLMRSQAG